MILDSFDLSGKVALVSGASRGLGQAMALGLAEAGADIAGVSRGDCRQTEAAIATMGRRFMLLKHDLATTTPQELEDLVFRVVRAWGRLDILVNAAGITIRQPVLDCSPEAWEQVMQVNLRSLMFLSQAAARYMLAHGGGKIINVASALSFQGGILSAPYAASKHGVVGVTRAMANELAEQHINVNAISPGYMLTDLTAGLAADPEREPAITARIPAGRWGTPADLKGAVVFLASAASEYCHGIVLPVDGAWLAR
ncbi:MAG: SDR family oxidoreductase [Chloroflexi bacterium]|nr:SDR family oxidoreductase [Chloroflexota bacterium]